ncbi:MAG: hypothetical protein AB7K24_21650 [Gemmataceae bacterium]
MRHSYRVVAGLLLLTTGLALQAQAPGTVPGFPGQATVAKERPREEFRIQSFRMKKTAPGVVQEILIQLLPAEDRIGGIFMSLGVSPNYSWRVVYNDSRRLVVVRGYRNDLEIAEEVVALLEAPADKPLPKSKRVRAFRLKNVETGVAREVIEALELNVDLAEAEGMLFMVGPDHLVDQLAKVIAELDVPAMKPLGPAPGADFGM